MDEQRNDQSSLVTGQAGEDLASCVHSIRGDLMRVVNERDFAYYGSCALYSLHIAALGNHPLRISVTDRDHLIALLKRAADRILQAFEPQWRPFAENGCNAAGRMIGYWSASNEQRSQIAPDRRADMIDQVRWLRNELHNRSILSELDARTNARRQQVVSWLCSQAVANSANGHEHWVRGPDGRPVREK